MRVNDDANWVPATTDDQRRDRRYEPPICSAVRWLVLRDPHRPPGAPKPLLRVGEASNPGPQHARWCATLGAAYKDPEVKGFWQARAPGHGAPFAEVSGQQRFALRVLTANTTSWGPLMRLLRNTVADVVLAQEHHLPPWRVAEASDWARRQGWHSTILPAAETGAGGWSAGVAVFARPHAALCAPRLGSETVIPSRAVAVCIEPPGHRPTLVISAYLKDGKGLAAENLRILAAIGTCIRMHGPDFPFLVGADFQMRPDELAPAGFGEKVGGNIMASGATRGTCRSSQACSELDYFVVQNALSLGVSSIETVENLGTKPHVPVMIQFHERITSARALFLRRPPPLAPRARVWAYTAGA